MRVQWAVHSSVASNRAFWLVFKIYHDLWWFNRCCFFPQILIYLNSSWIWSRCIGSLFRQWISWMLFSWIWKLFPTCLLWKLSVIPLDCLRTINKESVVSDWRFSCSYLIVNFHIKLVKLLMLLIILLLILRRYLLFIYKLLLLFRRNHVPILMTDHLVTLNPLMLLWTTSLP